MAADKIAKYRVEENKAGNWYWHEIGANGRKIGTSGQSFSSESAARKACENARTKAAKAPIEVRGKKPTK